MHSSGVDKFICMMAEKFSRENFKVKLYFKLKSNVKTTHSLISMVKEQILFRPHSYIS